MTTTTSPDEINVYEDLKGFLSADRADLRVAATDAVLQVRDRHGLESMVKQGLVAPLARNTNYPDHQVALNALKGLLYLSSHGTSAHQCIYDLMEAGGLHRMLEIVLSPSEPDEADEWKQRVNYAMGLLANMTRTEAGAVELTGRTLPDEAIPSSSLAESKTDHENDALQRQSKPSMELLLARFLNPAYVDDSVDYEAWDEDDEALDSQSSDPYQHFAAVLMNCTQVDAGQWFVLKLHYATKGSEGSSVLQSLLPQLQSPNPIRRRGVAGLISNCCLDQDSSFWLLHTVKITKHILYPLAGPEELDLEEKQGLDPDLWLPGPDKKREPDRHTRRMLVESLLHLCSTGRLARAKLRREKCQVILKWAGMVEEHEDVSEKISLCMDYLRREAEEEDSNDNIDDQEEEDKTDQGEMVTYKPSASRYVGSDENYDDVD